LLEQVYLQTKGIVMTVKNITDYMQQLNVCKLTHEELESLIQQRTAALRSLSARLLRVQDEERRRLARELHDSTGQTLTALKLQIASLEECLKSGRPASEIFAQTNALADQALQDIRTTSYLLYPPLLHESGFSSAARWYVEGFAKRSNIEVRLHLETQVRRLQRSIEATLFRVLQESLTNMYRHSDTRLADVRLQLDKGTVILEVQDYGKGIPQQLLNQFKETGIGVGVGLSGMRERIESSRGRLEIISGNTGTKVRASVPLKAANRSVESIKSARAAAA
jgi:signal transduction histidine kinase